VSRDLVGAGLGGQAEKANHRTNNQGEKPSKLKTAAVIHCRSPFNIRDEEGKRTCRFCVASITVNGASPIEIGFGPQGCLSNVNSRRYFGEVHRIMQGQSDKNKLLSNLFSDHLRDNSIHRVNTFRLSEAALAPVEVSETAPCKTGHVWSFYLD
jgi:hypothetical protein